MILLLPPFHGILLYLTHCLPLPVLRKFKKSASLLSLKRSTYGPQPLMALSLQNLPISSSAAKEFLLLLPLCLLLIGSSFRN
jgi:hypothetical protein